MSRRRRGIDSRVLYRGTSDPSEEGEDAGAEQQEEDKDAEEEELEEDKDQWSQEITPFRSQTWRIVVCDLQWTPLVCFWTDQAHWRCTDLVGCIVAAAASSSTPVTTTKAKRTRRTATEEDDDRNGDSGRIAFLTLHGVAWTQDMDTRCRLSDLVSTRHRTGRTGHGDVWLRMVLREGVLIREVVLCRSPAGSGSSSSPRDSVVRCKTIRESMWLPHERQRTWDIDQLRTEETSPLYRLPRRTLVYGHAAHCAHRPAQSTLVECQGPDPEARAWAPRDDNGDRRGVEEEEGKRGSIVNVSRPCAIEILYPSEPNTTMLMNNSTATTGSLEHFLHVLTSTQPSSSTSFRKRESDGGGEGEDDEKEEKEEEEAEEREEPHWAVVYPVITVERDAQDTAASTTSTGARRTQCMRRCNNMMTLGIMILFVVVCWMLCEVDSCLLPWTTESECSAIG